MGFSEMILSNDKTSIVFRRQCVKTDNNISYLSKPPLAFTIITHMRAIAFNWNWILGEDERRRLGDIIYYIILCVILNGILLLTMRLSREITADMDIHCNWKVISVEL